MATHSAPPFSSAKEARFWTMSAITAAAAGAPSARSRGGPSPDDVVKALDRLYRNRRIDLEHARVLRIWGNKRREPDPTVPGQAGDARLWSEAIGHLEWPLRVRGIIG
jgi:hypothetical protein